MKMKRFASALAIILACLLSFSISGCSGREKDSGLSKYDIDFLYGEPGDGVFG